MGECGEIDTLPVTHTKLQPYKSQSHTVYTGAHKSHSFRGFKIILYPHGNHTNTHFEGQDGAYLGLLRHKEHYLIRHTTTRHETNSLFVYTNILTHSTHIKTLSSFLRDGPRGPPRMTV